MQSLVVCCVMLALICEPLNAEVIHAVDAPRPKSGAGKAKRSTCGPATHFTAGQQSDMLSAHNNHRSKEAAANMLELVWNDDLAARAQAWVDTCTWEHGMLTDCNGKPIGQNMYIASDSSGFPAMNAQDIASSWYSEKTNWNMGAGTCTDGKVCGHYTQEVWARSRLVGCGFAQCPKVVVGDDTWTNVLLCGCNYSEPGNMEGSPVYLTGAPCSNCDSDKTGATYKCSNNLCQPQ